MAVISNPGDLSTQYLAVGLMMSVFGVYFLLLLWRFVHLKMSLLRMTILDLRFALYLPAFALVTYLSANSCVMFIIMEIPLSIAEAYILLNFFAVLVEYTGTVNKFLSTMNFAIDHHKELSRKSKEQSSSVSLSFRHTWISQWEATTKFHKVCRAIRMQFLIRPFMILINALCLLFGGDIGISVAIVFHLISILMMLKGVLEIASLYYIVQPYLKQVHGVSKQSVFLLMWLSHTACRSAVYFGFRLQRFEGAIDGEAHLIQIRFAIMLLCIYLMLAPFYLCAHGWNVQIQRLLVPHTTQLNNHHHHNGNNNSNNNNLKATSPPMGSLSLLGWTRSCNNVQQHYQQPSNKIVPTINNDHNNSNNNNNNNNSNSHSNGQQDLEMSMTLVKKKPSPMDERFINVHADAVYDFDFEAAPPLTPPRIPANVPPLLLPAKVVDYKTKNALKKLNKLGTAANNNTSTNFMLRNDNATQLNFYSFLEQIILLHDIFSILSFSSSSSHK